MAFLVIRDISGKLQVTVEKEKNAELAALVDQLTLDSVVTVEGEVVANESRQDGRHGNAPGHPAHRIRRRGAAHSG